MSRRIPCVPSYDSQVIFSADDGVWLFSEAMNTEGLSLKNFFVFNSTFGQREGEEEQKILWYYPPGANIDIQIKNVGLSEAIIKFASTFSKEPCDSLKTEKTVWVFHEPEPNFWMVFTLNCPVERKASAGGDIENVYKGCEVKPSAFKGILRQMYAAVRCLVGPFQRSIDSDPCGSRLRRCLGCILTEFTSKKIWRYGIKGAFVGDLEYLPLSTGAMLTVQYFVNSIEATHPIIENTLLLYKHNLVWSGLSAENTHTLLFFVRNQVSKVFRERNKKIAESESYPSPRCADNSLFVTGPQNLDDISYNGKLPSFWIDSCQPPGFRSLIIYHYNYVTICWLINQKSVVSMENYRLLKYNVMNRLDDQLLDAMRTASFGSRKEFLYHNETNLAVKPYSFNQHEIPLLIDIYDAHKRVTASGTLTSCETIVKMEYESSFICRSSNSRHALLQLHREKTLIDISSEADKVFGKELKNIFFHI